MNLTYRTLKKYLDSLSDEQLDDNVTVYLSEYDEYYPVEAVYTSESDDVLHSGHVYLTAV